MSGPDTIPQRVAPGEDAATTTTERRLAVIDMGSNTFRLVVFHHRPDGPFQLTEEVRESVRLSAGQSEGGRIAPDARARAAAASRLYAIYCEGSHVHAVDAVATSAVREAHDPALLGLLSAGGRLPVRPLSARQEAHYAFLGAVNSTDLRDGAILDLGGGSLQLGRVDGRRLGEARSWPLGAVRTTELVLGTGPVTRLEKKALRRHVQATVGDASWLGGPGGMVAMGGTVRTLAVMAQRAAGYPLDEIHGYRLERDAIGALIDQMAPLPARERARLPGLKADRADITLAGAVVLATVMDLLDLPRVEVCSQGLRWGVFYEHHLGVEDPRFPDVRAASVRNVAQIYRYDRAHSEHVAMLALRLFDEMARLGLHAGDPRERELLWAASLLHDVGVIVDYNDHHKHGEYLVLNAGLPGFAHRELVLVALLVRGHRKSLPGLGALAPVLAPGDDERYMRMAACLRIAEQLERGRGQRVRGLRLRPTADGLELVLDGLGDVSLARWAAAGESAVLERATGRRMVVGPDPSSDPG